VNTKPMLVGAGVLMIAGTLGVAQCLVVIEQKCCNIVGTPYPDTSRGPCTNDPPGTNCGDIILENPTVQYVMGAAYGHKTTLVMLTPQLCKWQARYCNGQGFCTVSGPLQNECYPSDPVAPFQVCP
jgi:hypothetical protein